MQRERFNLVSSILFMACGLLLQTVSVCAQTVSSDSLAAYINYIKNTNLVEISKESLPRSGRVYKTFFGNNPSAKIKVYAQIGDGATISSSSKPNGLIVFVDESSNMPRILARGFVNNAGLFDGPLYILGSNGNPDVQLVFNNGTLNQIATKGFVSEFNVDEPPVMASGNHKLKLEAHRISELRAALEGREDFKIASKLIPKQKTRIKEKLMELLFDISRPDTVGEFVPSANTALKVANLLPAASELTLIGGQSEQQASRAGINALLAPGTQIDFRDSGKELTDARNFEGSQ
ncbi:MAG: hypothetical protein COV44_08420 [Deltaproteobacteria bacterium CG11_big_fil_rev_8_21_14_0_20_45_16]|nr:MAG: hypothetical protein COV44_08420 [Deltaproteobacteria bacterium CG11_big_fil_rev_8_21_14_0_20_45_16]